MLQFWHKLYALDKLGLLDRDLSKELFSYQFSYWDRHLRSLADNTKKYDNEEPETLKAFSEDQLSWLKEDE